MSHQYRNYRDLAKHQIRGKDYRIVVNRRPASAITVVAPHGGSIERYTSQITRAIAGDEFSFYLFEGMKKANNYAALHLTSTKFDEPTCLDLLSESVIVLTVHGCDDSTGYIHVGGLDICRAVRITRELRIAGFNVVYPSETFPGREHSNICNRGKTRKGVQLELSESLRKRFEPEELAAPIRRILLERSEGEVS